MRVIKSARLAEFRTGTFIPQLISDKEQGRRSGESARLPPMWVDFVVGSPPCTEDIVLRVLRIFPSLPKNSNSSLLFQIPFRSGIKGPTSLPLITTVS